MATYNKSHTQKSLVFDGIIQIPFDNVASVTASQAGTAVSASLPLAADFKVMHVSATTTAISGSPAFQIVVGNSTAGTIGAVDTVAVQGTTVFSSFQSVTAAAGVTQTFYPDVYDAIYTGSNPSIPVVSYPLSVRYLTGSGDTASNLKIVISGKCIDRHSAATSEPSPDGTTNVLPSTF